MKRDQVFAEFKAYWQIADELLEKATKEQLSTVARILALQSAHYARKYGELPLPNLFELLKITEISPKELELLRDGTEALVGVLATVTDGLEDEPDSPMQ
jgi:acetyl-CoA acetyltransferase